MHRMVREDCGIGERHERAFRNLRRSRETRVVRGKIDLADEAIGSIDVADAGQLEFVRQPILQAVASATATSSLAAVSLRSRPH